VVEGCGVRRDGVVVEGVGGGVFLEQLTVLLSLGTGRVRLELRAEYHCS